MRETRIGVAAVAALGLIVAAFLYFGNTGAVRPEVDPIAVEEVLVEPAPAGRWGSGDLHVVGWYAELDADCAGDDGGADESVAWLQRDCPLRVLLPEQPAEGVTQAELEREGLRLAAPLGNRFPSRPEPGGPNLRAQPLVFVGHFDDEAATRCVPERRERCRNTLVVTDYDELYR
jgi:hypothetical protein